MQISFFSLRKIFRQAAVANGTTSANDNCIVSSMSSKVNFQPTSAGKLIVSLMCSKTCSRVTVLQKRVLGRISIPFFEMTVMVLYELAVDVSFFIVDGGDCFVNEDKRLMTVCKDPSG